MKLNTLVFQSVILVTLQVPFLGLGQTRIILNQTNSCSYYGERIVDDIYGFSSSPEAIQTINKIVNAVGLEPNFIVKAANVPNALASIEAGHRVILYSQNFMLSITNTTGTNWSSISILAHEIGHHLNGHTLGDGGSRPDLELQADKFSGFVCARMGATLAEAQAAMKVAASSAGSSTHPPKSARLEAIAVGWNQEKSERPTPITTVDPKPTETNTVEVPKPTEANTVEVSISYLGDLWGCVLPIKISIGGRSFTPISNFYSVKNIPVGDQEYTITGQVNCSALGACTVYGKGTISVEEGKVFYVVWKNTTVGKCDMWLQE